MGQSNYIKRLTLFVLPVVIVYGLLEFGARSVETKFKFVGNQLNEGANNIIVLGLGTSQMETGLNPEYMKTPAANLAEAFQHHNTDLKAYKSLSEKLKHLKVVILDLSFAHFHVPHHYYSLWKNSLFLNYYGFSITERKTRFYDYLLFNSAPGFFKRRMLDQYIWRRPVDSFNYYGFAKFRSQDLHRELEYDQKKIDSLQYPVPIDNNDPLLDENIHLFKVLVEQILKDGNKVVICKFPIYGNTVSELYPNMLADRDSVLSELLKVHQQIVLMDMEKRPDLFDRKHFMDRNHLNPSGARIFTRKLDSVVNELLND